MHLIGVMRCPAVRGNTAALLVFAVLIGGPAAAAARRATRPVAAPRPVNRVAATIQQFEHRVDAYRKLRAQIVAKNGALPRTSDPAVIADREHHLGEAIREARPAARQGDIFTARAGALIRRLIARDLARRRPVDRHAFVVEQPDAQVRPNDFYPLATVPLATIPPRLLSRLPRLPDGLEYRFVGRSLILRDVDPNLVVDVLPDAIPAQYGKR